MSDRKYEITKRTRQRLIDLRDAEVPMWKIEKILGLSEAVIRRHYPDVLAEVPVQGGMPAWCPNPEQTRQIEIMAGMGISPKRIALVVGVSPKLLEKTCGDIIARASVLMDMKVGANIYKMATGDVTHKNTALMAAFWAKTRMKWQEVQRVETTGLDGGPIQSQVQVYLPSNGRDDGDSITISGTAAEQYSESDDGSYQIEREERND